MGDRQGKTNRHRRIDRIATAAEHRDANFGGVRFDRDDHGVCRPCRFTGPKRAQRAERQQCRARCLNDC